MSEYAENIRESPRGRAPGYITRRRRAAYGSGPTTALRRVVDEAEKAHVMSLTFFYKCWKMGDSQIKGRFVDFSPLRYLTSNPRYW